MPHDNVSRPATPRSADSHISTGDGKASSRSPLQVGFLPFWIENPYQEKLKEKLEPLGISVSRLGRSGVSVLARLLRDRPRIIHLHWLDPLYDSPRAFISFIKLTGSISILSLLQLTGTRIVWTAHNLQKHENRNARIDRLCTAFVARSADAVIAHCPSAKSMIVDEFDLPDADRVHVVPHGNYCDTYSNDVSPAAARELLDLSPDELVFLFLGRVRPYKGVLDMIRAFRRLDRAKARLIIAGKPLNDESRREIKQAIAGDERIRFFAGFVADEDVEVYMNACNAVVLPYRDVFTSGAAILAMSFDRACIAPDLGCMTDWFEDGGAILYRAEDPDGLQKSMNEAAGDPARLESMGLRNGRLARQWSWEHVADETNRIYRLVANDGRADPKGDKKTTPR